jgi:hypothetical protein
MSLPEAREGISISFHTHQGREDEWTLGDPERIIWSSIRQMGISDVADAILYRIHNVKSQRSRSIISGNLKIYFNQAYEFYEAGLTAKSNTAPLFYYYSFLNLAKSICEIAHPNFHKMQECYHHGIGWTPNREYLVNMEREKISITQRGVWHVFWEAVKNQPCNVPNPLRLEIKELFAFGVETTDEYGRAFGKPTKFIEMIEPEAMADPDFSELWLQFSVDKSDLRILNLSRPKLLQIIKPNSNNYRSVKSKSENLWTFELENPVRIPRGYEGTFMDLLQSELDTLNVFVHPGPDSLQYHIPIQTQLPLQLPQINLLYTLMFWLSSLVRYDPHSVGELQESQYWMLIDGFMNQSRIWLLQLFEWELYGKETYLKRVI